MIAIMTRKDSAPLTSEDIFIAQKIYTNGIASQIAYMTMRRGDRNDAAQMYARTEDRADARKAAAAPTL